MHQAMACTLVATPALACITTVGPCRVTELVGRTAARIQLPSNLQNLRRHDVFRFSAVKPYESAEYNESRVPFQSELKERQASDLNDVFEVESIIDYKRAHASSQDPLDKGAHYLVHRRGNSSQHDMWLLLRALSNCLDKVADYLFQNASTRQRDVMIDQFARQERLQLSHLLARAQRTAIKPSNNVMYKPPRVTIRRRPRSKRQTGNAQQLAVLSTITPCTHCGRPVA